MQLVERIRWREGGVKGKRNVSRGWEGAKIKGALYGPFLQPNHPNKSKQNLFFVLFFKEISWRKGGVSLRVIVYGGAAFRVRSV